MIGATKQAAFGIRDRVPWRAVISSGREIAAFDPKRKFGGRVETRATAIPAVVITAPQATVAAGNGLGHAHDIGFEPEVLAGEKHSRAAETEQGAVAGAELANPADERVVGNEPAEVAGAIRNGELARASSGQAFRRVAPRAGTDSRNARSRHPQTSAARISVLLQPGFRHTNPLRQLSAEFPAMTSPGSPCRPKYFLSSSRRFIGTRIARCEAACAAPTVREPRRRVRHMLAGR